MTARRMGLVQGVVLWLCVAVAACGANPTPVTRVGPTTVRPTSVAPTKPPATATPAPSTVVLTPEQTRPLAEPTTTDPPTAIPATEEPAPTVDILDDLAQELFFSGGGAGASLCWGDPPAPPPAIEGHVFESHDAWICLWGFPVDSTVRLELYDPRGQLVAARDVTVDDELGGVGVVEILLCFAGHSTGQWTFVANSGDMHLEAPFDVAEPAEPVISVVPAGSDLFMGDGTLFRWQIPYPTGERVAIFGAGFPPGRTLPLGIYHEGETEARGKRATLIHSLTVRADEEGRFEFSRPVEALALMGEGTYYAVVALDPSYRPAGLSFEPHGAVAVFDVSSAAATTGDKILLLERGGGPLEKPTVQREEPCGPRA